MDNKNKIIDDKELTKVSGGDEYWASRSQKVTCSKCGSTDFTSLGCRESGYEIEWSYQCNHCGNIEILAVTGPLYFR